MVAVHNSELPLRKNIVAAEVVVRISELLQRGDAVAAEVLDNHEPH